MTPTPPFQTLPFGPEWNEIGTWFSSHTVLGASARATLLIEGGILYESGVDVAFLGLNSEGGSDNVFGPGGVGLSVSLSSEERQPVNFNQLRSLDNGLTVAIHGPGVYEGHLTFRLWISPRPRTPLWMSWVWPDYDIPLSTRKVSLPLVSLPSISRWSPEET